MEHIATFIDKVKEAKELRWSSRETAVPGAVGTALKSEYRERTPKSLTLQGTEIKEKSDSTERQAEDAEKSQPF